MNGKMNYIKKIEVFSNSSQALLQKEVNAFFAKEIEVGFVIHGIQFATTAVNGQPLFSCMIYYSKEEQEENNE